MDIGARFKTDIRGCTDNSTWTSIILRLSKRISARTVRPGVKVTRKYAMPSTGSVGWNELEQSNAASGKVKTTGNQ